jgi:hypothetical protein
MAQQPNNNSPRSRLLAEIGQINVSEDEVKRMMEQVALHNQQSGQVSPKRLRDNDSNSVSSSGNLSAGAGRIVKTFLDIAALIPNLANELKSAEINTDDEEIANRIEQLRGDKNLKDTIANATHTRAEALQGIAPLVEAATTQVRLLHSALEKYNKSNKTVLCGIEAKKLNEAENSAKQASKSKNKAEAKRQTERQKLEDELAMLMQKKSQNGLYSRLCLFCD